MISRRESLRTLAAGGAAVVGATAVRTVPAFAYDAPSIVSSFVLFVDGVTAPMGMALQPGQATCPGSAVDCEGCDFGVAQNMVLEVTASVVASARTGVRWGWGATEIVALDPANEFTTDAKTRSVDPVLGGVLEFSKFRGGSGAPRDPEAGDTLLMVGRAVYRCTYASGSFAEVTETQALVFTFDGTNWQTSPAPG